MVYRYEKTPLILDIKGNSLDDGPGIRSVIFFKGCPLSCNWCQNPEAKDTKTEISFDQEKCIGCDSCKDVCETGALNSENRFFINRNLCSFCFKCIDVCPSSALEKIGCEMQIDQIIEQVKRDIRFYQSSDGGVTFSGGEATLFMHFTSRLAKELKDLNIHLLLETCGYFNYDQFEKLLLPFIDLIYHDIKIHNSDEHRRLCGKGNRRILRNFEKLYRQFLDGGVEVLPRIPLIQELTATDLNLKSIASFFRKVGVKKIGLLPNNPTWIEKEDKLGNSFPSDKNVALRSWMTNEELRHCRSYFKNFEII